MTTTAEFCDNEYERPGGREPGDRIVRCSKSAGHADDHAEDGGPPWPNIKPKRNLATLKFGDLVRVQCSATGRYLADGWAMFVSAMDNDLAVDRATDAEPWAESPVPTDEQLRGALAMYFARSTVMSRG